MMKVFALNVLACLLAMSQFALAQEVGNFSLEAIPVDSNADAGSKFELKEHKGKTVVLHFLLKTECPICLRYTHEYAKLAETTPDVVHVFIKPDSEKEIREWTKNLVKVDGVKHPTIYRDPDAKLAKQFKIPDGYQFHGQSVHYPALVALNGEGKEMFRYVGKSNRDRMPKEDFVKKLEAVKAK